MDREQQNIPIEDRFFHSYDPTIHANPYPFYRKLQAQDPLHHIADRNVIVAARYDDVVQVLKDPTFIREWHKLIPVEERQPEPEMRAPIWELQRNWMLFRDPPTHTRLRGLASKAFTPKMLERLAPRIEGIAHRLLDDIPSDAVVDLIGQYAFPLPVIVIAELLGVPVEDRDQFKEWSNIIARILDIASVTEDFIARANAVAIEMRDYFRDLVRTRGRQPQPDLISAMVAAQEHGDALSEDELISTCILLLVAGHETTVNLISNGVLLLLTHPDQFARLVTFPELTPSAVEEILRFESPVQMTTRLAEGDVQLSSGRIPQGTEVFVMLAAANRDETQFANPDQFDIARSTNKHLAFALGPHFCLGAPLARMEGIISLKVLLKRYPQIRLASPSPVWRETILFRGLQALPVSLGRAN